MYSTELLYRCSLCGKVFGKELSLSQLDVEQLVDSILYGTQPPASSFMKSVYEREKHSCTIQGHYREIITKQVGIGDFIGFRNTKIPDENNTVTSNKKLSRIK